LDEYVDLNPRFSDQSYRCFMDQNLFNVVNIKLNHTHFPTPNTVNGQYEQLIANANGVDIALLGVGVNGHIAFNEPRSPLDSITRIVNLTPSTRQANARFFNNNVGAVPKQAITCGLQTILNARRIILIATGHAKKLALTKLMHTKIYDPH
jgi:glucosamine-6-phosphate deaminase